MHDNVVSLLKDVRELIALARTCNPGSDEGNSLFPPTVALTVEDLELLHDTIEDDAIYIDYLHQRMDAVRQLNIPEVTKLIGEPL